MAAAGCLTESRTPARLFFSHWNFWEASWRTASFETTLPGVGCATSWTAALLLSAAIVGCSSSAGDTTSAEDRYAAEVGFVELGEAQYAISRTALTASPARLFYNFQPARDPTPETPLLVLGGGGPAASTLFLLGWNSAPMALADDGATARVEPNPDPLTRIGHLLSIDSRAAGLSYGWLADSSSEQARSAELTARNHNVYRDSADVLLVLADFVARHPELEHSPVYFVTESYGGLRSIVASHLLRFRESYAAGERPFFDPALPATLEGLALNLRGQILIQPFFAGERQRTVTGAILEEPGSVVDQIAAAAGIEYLRCSERTGACDPFENAMTLVEDAGLSEYDYRASADWLADHADLLAQAGANRESLAALTGVAEEALDDALRDRPPGAFRFADPALAALATRGDLDTSVGGLPSHDTVFVDLNREALTAFYSAASVALEADPNQASWPDFLFETLPVVPTLITRADYDLTVYGPALVPLLSSYAAVLEVSELGDETLSVTLVNGSSGQIWAPRYPNGAHALARDVPEELHADIAAFVAATR